MNTVPRKVREGKIVGDYFLVPQIEHCYKVNPSEQRIINALLEKYGKNPTKSIEDKFNESGKKVKISINVTVALYLEIEEALSNARMASKQLNKSGGYKVLPNHIYYTYRMKQQLVEKFGDKFKIRVRWENNQEVVYGTPLEGGRPERLGEVKLVLKEN